jgi:hypothetical protein
MSYFLYCPQNSARWGPRKDPVVHQAQDRRNAHLCYPNLVISVKLVQTICETKILRSITLKLLVSQWDYLKEHLNYRGDFCSELLQQSLPSCSLFIRHRRILGK